MECYTSIGECCVELSDCDELVGVTQYVCLVVFSCGVLLKLFQELFDRLTGVKRLRVRGLKAVSFAATLKALGLNILRSARFKYEQNVAFAA